jgi:hypothetical protein
MPAPGGRGGTRPEPATALPTPTAKRTKAGAVCTRPGIGPSGRLPARGVRHWPAIPP